MSPENFCYWLQGFMELSNERTLTPEQVQSIRDHLNLVFIKLTPLACATPISDPNLTADFAKAIEEGQKGMKEFAKMLEAGPHAGFGGTTVRYC